MITRIFVHVYKTYPEKPGCSDPSSLLHVPSTATFTPDVLSALVKVLHPVNMLRDSLQLFCAGINSPSPVASSQRKSVTNLLRDFDTPGVFPPSARIDRSLKSQQQDSFKLWDAWRWPIFAANKGLHVFTHPL